MANGKTPSAKNEKFQFSSKGVPSAQYSNIPFFPEVPIEVPGYPTILGLAGNMEWWNKGIRE